MNRGSFGSPEVWWRWARAAVGTIWRLKPRTAMRRLGLIRKGIEAAGGDARDLDIV
jgi:hypothetical protein